MNFYQYCSIKKKYFHPKKARADKRMLTVTYIRKLPFRHFEKEKFFPFPILVPRSNAVDKAVNISIYQYIVFFLSWISLSCKRNIRIKSWQYIACKIQYILSNISNVFYPTSLRYPMYPTYFYPIQYILSKIQCCGRGWLELTVDTGRTSHYHVREALVKLRLL